MVVIGLNQNVDILGRVFHVQTEVTVGAEPKVRTTVFVGGRIVGSREALVEVERTTHDEVLEQINAQHALIIDNLFKRAKELQERKMASIQTGEAQPQPELAKASVEKRASPPDPDATPRLALSLATRKLLCRFANLVDRTPATSGTKLRARIESSVDEIDEIMTSETFPDIRLDEQLRFFDLRERIGSWRTGDDNLAIGMEIWSEIVVFADHLGLINHRRELVTYDRALLMWSIAEIGKHGITAETMAELRHLSGRDIRVDTLLQADPPASGEQWMELLFELLDRVVSEDP